MRGMNVSEVWRFMPLQAGATSLSIYVQLCGIICLCRQGSMIRANTAAGSTGALFRFPGEHAFNLSEYMVCICPLTGWHTPAIFVRLLADVLGSDTHLSCSRPGLRVCNYAQVILDKPLGLTLATDPNTGKVGSRFLSCKILLVR